MSEAIDTGRFATRLRLDGAHMAHVQALSGRGLSRQNIARMTGVAEADVWRLLPAAATVDPHLAGPRLNRIWAEQTVTELLALALRIMAAVQGPEPSPDAMVLDVAMRHGVTVADLKGPSRRRKIARARQAAMWVLRHHATLSLPKIGYLLGDRDHTTVMHGIAAHEGRLAAQQQEMAA